MKEKKIEQADSCSSSSQYCELTKWVCVFANAIATARQHTCGRYTAADTDSLSARLAGARTALQWMRSNAACFSAAFLRLRWAFEELWYRRFFLSARPCLPGRLFCAFLSLGEFDKEATMKPQGSHKEAHKRRTPRSRPNRSATRQATRQAQ